jgi:peptidoglycan/xylan/chitin deacetylase (PgdA/CDA1 family)
MHVGRSFALILLVLCVRMSAQHRSVAITVDDLPFVAATENRSTSPTGSIAQEMNRKLLRILKRHRVPVTGFVSEQGVSALGTSGSEILRQWLLQGFDLGNHTYSHPDINTLSVPQIEDEILRGETTLVPLMKQAGKNVEFFRFPMNHTGDTKAKHDAIAAFLAAHQYKVATCTIDNSDYLFNAAYLRILANNDYQTAKKLLREYLTYTSLEIDYYASLNKRVLGYEPPQVMVLHDNRLNSDTIDSVLKLFERKGYAFVSLGKAQSDAAYVIPDTYITEYGPMWGYRWARERNIKVNGRLEPDPPDWVLALAKVE